MSREPANLIGIDAHIYPSKNPPGDLPKKWVDARIVATVRRADARTERWDTGLIYLGIELPTGAPCQSLGGFIREKVQDDLYYDMHMSGLAVLEDPRAVTIAWHCSDGD